MLSGFISLCTTFYLAINYNPLANWYNISKACGSGRGPVFNTSSKFPYGQN